MVNEVIQGNAANGFGGNRRVGVFLNGISQIRNGIKAQLLSLVVYIVHAHIHIGENMVAVIIVTLDFARPDLLEPEAAFKFLRQL